MDIRPTFVEDPVRTEISLQKYRIENTSLVRLSIGHELFGNHKNRKSNLLLIVLRDRYTKWLLGSVIQYRCI